MLALHPVPLLQISGTYTVVPADRYLLPEQLGGLVRSAMEPSERKHEEWAPNQYAWDPYLVQAERHASGVFDT